MKEKKKGKTEKKKQRKLEEKHKISKENGGIGRMGKFIWTKKERKKERKNYKRLIKSGDYLEKIQDEKMNPVCKLKKTD